MDTTSYFAGNSDKCPKCGAAKVFSALRCPACGTEYAAAAPNRSGGATNAGFTSASASNFDLNASFSAYKKSIEPQAEAAEAAAVGAAAGITAAGVAGAANTAAQGANSGLSDIAELNKPVELDPIARKLQSMSNQNTASTPNNTSAPMPGVYIPGASNRSSSYQGSQAQSNPYQGVQPQSTSYQSAQQTNTPAPGVWYPGMPAQNNAGQGTSYQGGAGQASSNQGSAPQGMRFQGRPQESQVSGYNGAPGMAGNGAPGASPYASPYASPNFGAAYGSGITEKPKKSIGSKIFVAILLLGLAALIGYGFYRYNNSDKNENGVSYSTGQSGNGMYTNDWAEIKIDLSKEITDQSFYMDTPSIKSTIDNLNYQWRDKDADAVGVFLAGKEFHDGFANGMLPAVMMYVITDNSFNAKLFGAKVEDFFYEYRLTGGGFSLSLNKASDMVLCGQTYKTFVTSLPMGDGRNLNMYMCVRSIGNKLVLLYLYEIPGYYELNTLKSYFID